MEELQRECGHAAYGEAADGRMHPARHRGELPEASAEAEQPVSERNRDDGREQAEPGIPDERGCISELVCVVNVKDRVFAEDTVFDDGGQCGGDDDAGEHGLVEVADQLFERKGDGGDGRVEGRGDAGRHADRGQAAAVFGAETGGAGQHAADAGANLHGWALQAERGAGADLDCAKNEFADGLAHGDVAVAQRVGHFDLGNAAACRGGGEVGEAETGKQAA